MSTETKFSVGDTVVTDFSDHPEQSSYKQYDNCYWTVKAVLDDRYSVENGDVQMTFNADSLIHPEETPPNRIAQPFNEGKMGVTSYIMPVAETDSEHEYCPCCGGIRAIHFHNTLSSYGHETCTTCGFTFSEQRP